MALIESGAYKPGERLPSIREMSRHMRVSINTVKTAYDLLEMNRRIAPRPQSGYYVRGPLPEIPSEPPIRLEALVPTEPTIDEIAAQVHRDVDRTDLVRLGAAVPNPQALPSARLARLLAREAQARPSQSAEYQIGIGEQRLREQIAKLLLEGGSVVAPSEVVITTGCQEAVTHALLALCEPGDTVAIESPTYFSFIRMLERLRLNAIEIPGSSSEGISLEALEYALDHQRVRACLFTPNFSNPLGSLMPDENKERLARLLQSRGVPLIEDDIYGDLCHGSERPRTVKSFDDSGTVVLCSSFTKTLCPGYRVGWIVAGPYHARILQVKMALSVATPTPTQLAVGAYLASGAYPRHLRKARALYASNVARMAEAVGACFPDGTRVSRPRGGFVLWVEVPPPFDSLRLYEEARKRGISVAPGSIFSLTGKFRNALRLNAAVWSPETAAGLRTVGELARESLRPARAG